MKALLRLAPILILCASWVFWRAQEPLPVSGDELLQRKAQGLVDEYLGPGQARVTVTLDASLGLSHQQDTVVGPERLVTGRQEREEAYSGGDAPKGYRNHVVSEKAEVSHHLFERHALECRQRVNVAVITRRPAPAQLQPLLQCGLGLNPQRGDQLFVCTRPGF